MAPSGSSSAFMSMAVKLEMMERETVMDLVVCFRMLRSCPSTVPVIWMVRPWAKVWGGTTKWNSVVSVSDNCTSSARCSRMMSCVSPLPWMRKVGVSDAMSMSPSPAIASLLLPCRERAETDMVPVRRRRMMPQVCRKRNSLLVLRATMGQLPVSKLPGR